MKIFGTQKERLSFGEVTNLRANYLLNTMISIRPTQVKKSKSTHVERNNNTASD